MVTSIGAGSERRALIVGTAVTVTGSLPVFFIGAMAVQLTRDLGFGTVGIGAATAVFFGSMAVSAPFLGRAADRLGATRSLRIATLASALASGGIALLAWHWWMLAVWLALAGMATAFSQPAVNRLLVNRVRLDRLGTAFGLKQSAPPTASMLAGLSVPAIALTIGWQWAYVATAVAALAATVAVGPRPATPPTPPSRREGNRVEPLRDRPTLVVLALGFTLAFASSSVLLSYYVDSAVHAGEPQDYAGLVFALASLTAVAARVLAGMACDRYVFRPLNLCAVFLGFGAAGLALMAVGGRPAMTLGAVLGLTGTWGFPGVFWFALVRAYPDTPGRITGAMAPAAGGAMFGPVLFGVLASGPGYPIAWSVSAVTAMLAGVAMLFGARRLPSTGPQLETAPHDTTPTEAVEDR